MKVTVRLFERLEGNASGGRDAVDPLDGVLAVEELPHQRMIIAGVVITDPSAELIGRPVEFWGRCVPAGRADGPAGRSAEMAAEAAAESPAFTRLVDINEAAGRHTFVMPVRIDVSDFGDYEVVISNPFAEVGRAPLEVTLDL
ncbi:MAG: hypothetical protein QF664_10130 [Dehalococcoidia bacterium]|mgnify:FL=1|jgi:hypothetical protein|nr:hypothetical protein [Dehalococcoidia bacterium]